jgi:hypothetical protein
LDILTTSLSDAILYDMDAELLLNERHILSERAFVELVVWRLPRPLPGSSHPFKYRLALVVEGTCVLRYDNEAGKGDHKHMDDQEMVFEFTTPAELIETFWEEVDKRRV